MIKNTLFLTHSSIRKMLVGAGVGLIFILCMTACSRDQLRRGTYYSLHEQQRQACLDEGRIDCDQYGYESYDEYQRKRQESHE